MRQSAPCRRRLSLPAAQVQQGQPSPLQQGQSQRSISCLQQWVPELYQQLCQPAMRALGQFDPTPAMDSTPWPSVSL